MDQELAERLDDMDRRISVLENAQKGKRSDMESSENDGNARYATLRAAKVLRESAKAMLLELAYVADGDAARQLTEEIWFPKSRARQNAESQTVEVQEWLIERKESEIAENYSHESVEILIA